MVTPTRTTLPYAAVGCTPHGTAIGHLGARRRSGCPASRFTTRDPATKAPAEAARRQSLSRRSPIVTPQRGW
jgi:hypothetical protein